MRVDNATTGGDVKSPDRFWTAGRILSTVVVAALLATVGYLTFSNSGMKTESRLALPGTAVSDAATTKVPDDYELPTIEGDTIRLSDYRGKVLVVDFWAVWCPPCREEVPQLARIAEQNRSRGVEVIGLHVDDKGRSSPSDIRKFMGQYGINYTVGMASDDVFTAYLGEVETRIPQTLVFDRDGHLVAHLVGYTASDARLLDEAVNRALAAS